MWVLWDRWRNGPFTPFPGTLSNCKAVHGKQAAALKGKEVTNCGFKDRKSRWCALNMLPCWLFHSPWRPRHARARFCFPAGLRKMVAPSYFMLHLRWRGLMDWYVLLKEFGLFHKQCKMMEEGSHTSLLPVQCFFLSRLKKFTRELRGLAFLTDYPIEIYTMQQNAFSRQITQICSMSLFHNLSAHREVWTGTAFCSVISFYFKSDLQFPDRKSEQKSCKIYYCDHITFLCGLLSI